jgi:hypothetical protein
MLGAFYSEILVTAPAFETVGFAIGFALLLNEAKLD